ncbi:hypothetical protein [Microbulbifer sp. VAAF005]|uniref:hypothetical protein n=1 Tax=Microbulbifer sp. VAAF005 TaxID=3034230 RepID=UPI0024ADE2CD|nr:hypothetical protein [Microbulbifer sp. VAAF005]WHI48434.1 hypothetical protein P0078_08695 [Microbulbifer sp. VAAF005]
MGTHTNQLTSKERYQIEVLNGQSYSARAIALQLNRFIHTMLRALISRHYSGDMGLVSTSSLTSS